MLAAFVLAWGVVAFDGSMGTTTTVASTTATTAAATATADSSSDDTTSSVTDREQAIAAVEQTASELGRLDIVINNAGVMLLGPIVDAQGGLAPAPAGPTPEGQQITGKQE